MSAVRLPLAAALDWAFRRPGRVIVSRQGRRFRVAREGDHLQAWSGGYWTAGGPNIRADLLGPWLCEEA